MARRARRSAPSGATEAREKATQSLLDAAEGLLKEVGYAGITTRALAEKAGVNHGLVHYYFGSMEEVFVQVLERFTEKLVERQREMYAADVPFIDKWRTAWDFQETDLDDGYNKIWLELQAMSWNHPEMKERIAQVDSEWRAVLIDAFSAALEDYGVTDQFPPAAMVAMVMTISQGFTLERLSNIQEGHREMLAWIDAWLVSLEEAKAARERG